MSSVELNNLLEENKKRIKKHVEKSLMSINSNKKNKN